MRIGAGGGESMSANEYGLDVSYMKGKLKIFLRDIDRHTPDEAARVLARLSKVADEKVLREPEFGARDTYRELCGELLAELREARLFFDYDFLHDLYQEKSLMGGINKMAAAITKAEKLLGEQK
jgi:hypothetical protein